MKIPGTERRERKRSRVKNDRPLVTCLDGVPDEFILNPKDVGAICDVSRETAGELLATGEIRGMFRIGRQLRIYAGDLRKHIESEKVPRNPHLDDLSALERRAAGDRWMLRALK
jgi:hypothetical protein